MSLNNLLLDEVFIQKVGSVNEHYQKNDIILKENDDGIDLFLVLSGQLQVRTTLKTEINHELASGLSKLEVGDIFGEIAIFDNEPRTAEVIASTNCEIVRINGSKLIQFMDDYPEKGYFIMRDLIFNLIANIRQSNLRTKTILELYLNQQACH